MRMNPATAGILTFTERDLQPAASSIIDYYTGPGRCYSLTCMQM